VKRLVTVTGAMILWACSHANAQDLANMEGTITDSSGGVIPDVSVNVANPDRGFTRKLTTDSSGAYTAARVPIGN
jgi:hypothetical protein